MDKLKGGMVALALAGSVAVGSLLTGDPNAPGGSYRGGYYASTGSYRDGSVEETFRLLVRDQDLPNTTAVSQGWVEADSYYDQINESAAAEDNIRYGSINTSSPTAPYFNTNGGVSRRWGTDTEDNQTHPVFMTYLGFNATGLTEGHRVTEAFICLNVQRFASMNFSNGYLAARLDTIIADYAMLNSVSTQIGGSGGVDEAYLETSANEVDMTNTVAWSPTIASRDDAHDYGPRGWPNYPGGTLNAEDPIRLDVTDPVQQALDRGLISETGDWLIFVVYAVSTTQNNLSFMYGDGATQIPGGNPCLVVETSSVRGPAAWADGRLPVSMMVDDNYAEGQTFIQAIQDSAKTVGYLSTADFVSAGPTTYIDSDSLWTTNTTGLEFIVHGRTHTALGDLTGVALDPEVGRWWIADNSYYPTADIDTTGLNHFAWLGGGTFQYSIEAIEKLVDFGYEFTRASTTRWTAHEAVGLTTLLSWSAPVNMMMYEADFTLFGTASSAKTQSQILEDFTDKIDTYYTDHGKAAINIFTHSFAINGTTEANWRYMIGLVNSLKGVKHQSITTTLAQRDGVRIAPDAIAEFVGGVATPAVAIPVADSAAIANTAAKHDSLINLTGHDNLLEIWVGGK